MRNLTLLSCITVSMAITACTGVRVKSDYIGTSSMNKEQILQLLSQQGYTDVSDLHKNGDDWFGGAQKDGHVVNFDIDKGGTIHTK